MLNDFFTIYLYNLHAFLRNDEPGVSINVCIYIQLITYCSEEINLVVFELTLYFGISPAAVSIIL